MSLARWDPFSDIDTFFNRLMPGGYARWPKLGTQDARAECAPSADISETDQEFVIRASLPAVRKEDVKVTVDGEMITIKGERKQHKDDKTEKYHRVESFFGAFERSFTLPQNVNADAIRCESRDGVLTVHIPKAAPEKAKAKQITVQ